MNLSDTLTLYLLVMVRCGAFVTAMPLFRHGAIPRLVRVGLVVALTISLAPGVQRQDSLPSGEWLPWGLFVIREVLIGGLLGFALGLLLEPVKAAAEYIEDQMGLRLGQVSDPTAGVAATTLGAILEGCTILVIFAAGIHHILLLGLQRSFLFLGIGAAIERGSYQTVVQHAARVPELGIMLAFPLGLILFLVSIYSVVVLRAAAQFQYFTVGLTIRLLVGLMALPLLFPEIIWMTVRLFQHAGEIAEHVLAG